MNDSPASPPPPNRFAEGIELDLQSLDHPDQALRQALAADDSQKAIGAYRLLAASGQEPELEVAGGLKLGNWLLGAGMFLEAARTLRNAAEKNRRHPDAPRALFNSACLLMGPVHKPEAGAKMLRYLVGNYQDSELAPLADRMVEHWENGNQIELARCLEHAGIHPEHYPPAGSALSPPEDPAAPKSRPPPARLAWARTRGFRTISRLVTLSIPAMLAVFVISYLIRDSYRRVEDIDPALLEAPRQAPIQKPEVIRFTRNDHHFILTPRFHYLLHGLVVSKNDYTFLGLSRGSLVYLMDICVIWGGNLRSRAYQNPDLDIVQHGNVCYFQWKGNVRFNQRELSNNHIIAADDQLESEFESLGEGDQVRIEGWLVDVKVQPVRGGFFNPSDLQLTTSASRTDDGLGACEIIYAKNLQVLKAGTPLARWLNRVSFWALLLLGAAMILRLVWFPVGLRK